MSSYIHHIETLLPPYSYKQDFARDRMTQLIPGKRTQRLIHGIYDHSGIDTRYSVLPDFVPDSDSDSVLFNEDVSGRIIAPSTERRNQYYSEWSRDLSVKVSQRALENAHGFQANDVTHVITVSCTGFYSPGPDLEIVRGLGLPETVERYHLGFMGCYAAFPALRMAQQFCQARPDAVVLVVCLELCSLHLQLGEKLDCLLAGALFADGAAAALVSARRPARHRAALALHTFSSALALDGEGDMAWSIGDQGFTIRLSSYVPNIIAANIVAVVDRIMNSSPWSRSEIGVWAIHPGGRAILDKVQQELDLVPEQIADSRAVLRECGNMSSSTILFVLKRILSRSGEESNHSIGAMAFGPGLTIETALLERVSEKNTPASMKRRAHASPVTV